MARRGEDPLGRGFPRGHRPARAPHRLFRECRDAFGCPLEDYLYFGGYPGAMPLRPGGRRWLRYVRNSIVEPSIAIDVPLLGDVRRLEPMRRLFEVGAPYSGEEVSYRKLLEQLGDRGNTATIAHYLSLLSQAGLMSGLQKHDPKLLREKASSPRLMVHDTALMTAMSGRQRKKLRTDPVAHGRLVESAVGAYLINRSFAEGFSVYWWREGNDGVDFVVTDENAVTAIEMKSSRVKPTGHAALRPREPGGPRDSRRLGRLPARVVPAGRGGALRVKKLL